MESSDASSVSGWDTYWQGAGNAGAYSIGGVSHAAVGAFWNDLLAPLAADLTGRPLLDIASGSGAVVERIMDTIDPPPSSVTCVDVSATAVTHISERWPGINGIVANAADLPLDDGAFALVTSQFGIEYAGPDAVSEAARLVGAGGTLAMLLHVQGGSIEKQCRESLDAVRALSEAEFVSLARAFFEAGFSAAQGGARDDYDEAGRRLAPAVAAAEDILRRYGGDVAAGTVAKLYADVARIHERLLHYDPDEVLTWLDRMASELDAFAERMLSMCEAAISESRFDRLTETLVERGFRLERSEKLVPDGDPLPLAWQLVATRVSR